MVTEPQSPSSLLEVREPELRRGRLTQPGPCSLAGLSPAPHLSWLAHPGSQPESTALGTGKWGSYSHGLTGHMLGTLLKAGAMRGKTLGASSRAVTGGHAGPTLP